MTPPRNARDRGSARTHVEPRTCASCGRTITWRAKWADSWDEIRYCSDACRRRGVTAADRDAERQLREAMAGSSRGAVVELDAVSAAQDGGGTRDGAGTQDGAGERERMRRAARRLVAAGEAVMVQRGRVVDPSTARGPVGIRRVL